VPRYVECYTSEQREILRYKPGITDLATLLFRNEESLLATASDVESFYVRYCIPRKFALNLEYARRATFWRDLLIIVETVCPYWVAVGGGYLTALAATLWFSYELRFDFAIPDSETGPMLRAGLLVLPVQMICLVWRRELAGLLSYFSVPEMKQLASGLGLAAAVQAGLWLISGGSFGPPRSVIVIDCVLALAVLGGARGALRVMRERRRPVRETEPEPAQPPDLLRVGIVGAGELGSWLATELNFKRVRGRHVEVLFDDNPQKWHKRLHGIPIVGMPECILDGSWADRLDEVILAMPGATPERLAQVRDLLHRAKIRVRTVPSLEEILSKSADGSPAGTRPPANLELSPKARGS
jgi:FlaA1/EpsC-like NDP-sugar epimerase